MKHYRSFNLIIAFCFLIVSAVVAVMYFTLGITIKVPVFAIYTSYLQDSWFTVSNTNLLDEIIVITYVLGILLIIFSEHKTNISEIVHSKSAAFRSTAIIDAIFVILATLLIYGKGYIVVMLSNLYLIPALYLCLKLYYQRKDLKK